MQMAFSATSPPSEVGDDDDGLVRGCLTAAQRPELGHESGGMDAQRAVADGAQETRHVGIVAEGQHPCAGDVCGEQVDGPEHARLVGPGAERVAREPVDEDYVDGVVRIRSVQHPQTPCLTPGE